MCSGLRFTILSVALGAVLIGSTQGAATPRKVHVVGLGAAKRVPYSKTGDPAGALADEVTLKIRPLLVDGLVKEWTTGDAQIAVSSSGGYCGSTILCPVKNRLPAINIGFGNVDRGCWWIA